MRSLLQLVHHALQRFLLLVEFLLIAGDGFCRLASIAAGSLTSVNAGIEACAVP